MADYAFVRLNDERHTDQHAALDDLLHLVSAGLYYTRSEHPPRLARHLPLVGIGSHGGRGLFLLGVCAGDEWEGLPDAAPYLHRVEVLWEATVYGADYHAVLDGVHPYNERGLTRADQATYRQVVERVLAGEVVGRLST